ncbi:hypothetical protein CHS0354_012334, partial [Potamilus streckersoni]
MLLFQDANPVVGISPILVIFLDILDAIARKVRDTTDEFLSVKTGDPCKKEQV